MSLSNIEQIHIDLATLTHILSKMLGTNVINANYQTKQLHGGTLGDVRLVTGMAETADNRNIPYKVVWKTQKKWERFGDPDSWRREHDLYQSNFGAAFSDSFRLPVCYYTEMNDDEIQIWMEYIDGVSGNNLTIENLEQAAEELGRFQGRIYQQPELSRNLPCLGDARFMEREYSQWTPETEEYQYLYSDKCNLPGHLRQMLIATQRQSEMIFAKIKCLPVALCHRDF